MNESELRDQLSVKRTRLANERTLLAYIRTALGAAAGGAALLQFFPPHSSLVGLAWLLMATSIIMLAIGLYRFYKVKKELSTTK